MAAYSEENQLTLKLLVDKKKNEVLFAEAGKQFVDVLLSFLALPLATIVRLVGKETDILKQVRIGCLSSLYESVEDLGEQYFWTKACKKMLLKPKNYSMESYSQNLKLKIDDTEPTRYFVCDMCLIKGCDLVSTFRNLRCKCGDFLNDEIYSIRKDPFVDYDGFVHDSVTFIICDDLDLMPCVFGATMVLLQSLGVQDTNSIEEMTVNPSTEKVVDLLKFSLLSKTPLTDLFLKKKQFLEKSNLTTENMFKIGDVKDYKDVEVVLKVVRRKSNQMILYYEAGEDFVDILFKFLTFPLGGVLNLLEGSSSFHCIDTLYKSVAKMSAERHCFKSQELKDGLVKPKCPPKAIPTIPLGFSQEFVDGHFHGFFKFCSKGYHHGSMDYVDPTSTTGETSSGRGFLEGPKTYLVTDGLVVTAMSSFSAVSFLNQFKLPSSEVEKKAIRIGAREVLGILKASLISTSVLTNVFKELINVLDLFKFSLFSKTPLTDLFLKKKRSFKNSKTTSQNQFKIGDLKGYYKSERVFLKAVLRKSNQKVLFYEAEEDFVDMLFMFLTLPLGGVLNILEGSSSLYCLDTLYKSVVEMSADRCFKSQELKDALVNPNCPPKATPTIPICFSGGLSVNSCFKFRSNANSDDCMDYVDPTSTTGETSSDRGFVKVPSTNYMVTDDLVVTPMSSISAISILNRYNVPFCDIQEKVIRISPHKCFGILKASLVSTSALSNVLKEL